MDVKNQIKSLLQQAELYHSQGLLYEAKESYARAGQLIKKNEGLIKNKNLLQTILKKIQDIKDQIDRFENESPTVELPKKIQDIIKEKFAFSRDSDAAALEGAIALAKFGQFERALLEFNELIKKDSLRVEAAKNIIRCHKALDTIEKAVSLYHEWLVDDFFASEQLNKLRVFFQGILDSKKIDVKLPEKTDTRLPEIKEMADIAESNEADMPLFARHKTTGAEELIDISSVGITMSEGARKGEVLEYDVSFQAGNVINLLLSGSDKDFIENLKTDMVLNDVQFYSPIAMFSGKAIISSISKIESGPKQGYYSLDIKTITH
jgi:tetratricopeptide (TPR) repeat protein